MVLENELTLKEKNLLNSNPNVKYLLEKFDCEKKISKEEMLNSRINARVNFWMNEIIHPLNENKITSK